MSAIGPGDWVECAPPSGYRSEIPIEEVKTVGSYPTPGRIYCVRDVGRYLTVSGWHDGLRLVGIVASIPGHPDAWWEAECFRPIYRPKADLIERLMAPAPEAPVKTREAA